MREKSGETKKYESFIERLGDGNSVKCRFCLKVLKFYAGNVVRHLKNRHGCCFRKDKEASEEQLDSESQSCIPRKRFKRRTESTSYSVTDDNTSIVSTASSSANTSSNIKINDGDDPVVRIEYLKRVMNFLTRCYMPFSFFDESHVKEWLLPDTKLNSVQLSSVKVPIYLKELADRIRISIKQRIREKLLCLKLDYSHQENRTVLGISVNYIHNFKLQNHVIGVIELNDEIETEKLHELIWSKLSDFNIDNSQLYSISLANGEFTLKSSEVREMLREVEIHDGPPFGTYYNYELVFNELSGHMPVMNYIGDAMGIIANDVFQHFNTEIDECTLLITSICEESKNQEEHRVEMPIVENVPLWYKSYELLKAVTSWKDILDSKLFLNLDWSFVDNYCTVYKSIITFFNMVTADDFTIGDYYREWLMCECTVQQLDKSNLIAQMVLTLMNEHRQDFLENNKFLAAIFLDPRFCNKLTMFLTDAQQRSAIEQLLNTYGKLKSLGHIEPNVICELSENIEEPNKYSLLYTKAVENGAIDTSDQKFEQKLYNLKYRDRMSFSDNVLGYFSDLQPENPELAQISEIVLAFPSIQTTMQNTFKAIPSIAKRSNLKQSPEELERILLLKFNADLI